ncbi:GspL/Epsl periplasmic domain-containing protein [Pseudodesulfovibrio senegalensis]|uniref:GspL periplasmic domain-containing protein n=1 Tax=Pseudodesulfovibrio senegalensis TaxID=1721087 RepID=A0A6N6N121_9BACT|nr:GspL/Epsl periplasmic domain-containing protein [Pseudodesulfovibrio senegalensis]KAB1441423.1 hypothetical protein F8A88_10790 [Pseudodesulfovibrio senegalensis]
MASTLIVDVADGQISLVRLEGRGRKALVTGCAVMPAPDHDAESDALPQSLPQAVADAAADLAARHSLLADACVLGMDSRLAFLREYVFPFSSHRKIDSAMRFQLLEESPVPLDDLVLSSVRGPAVEAGTHVAAAALRREDVRAWLDAFDEAGMPVSGMKLDMDGLAACCPEAGPGRVVAVDMGVTRTVAAFMDGGKLLAGRIADMGEQDVLEALHRDCSLSRDAAERTLVFADMTEGGDSKAGSAEARATDCLRQGLENLCAALRRELALFQRHHGFWPEEMVVGGALSRVRGLKGVLEKHFDCRVRLWAEECAPAGAYDSVAERCGYMRAHGLANSLGRSGQSFDFCRGEFARSAGVTLGSSAVRRAAVFGGGMALAFLALALATAHSRSRRADELQQQVALVYKKALGSVRAGLSPMQYESIVRQRMAALNASRNADGQGSVLDVLAAVHGAAGAAPAVQLGELTLDRRRVAFKGTAPGFDAVERLRAALQESDLFAVAAIKESTAVNKGEGIRFAMELERVR